MSDLSLVYSTSALLRMRDHCNRIDRRERTATNRIVFATALCLYPGVVSWTGSLGKWKWSRDRKDFSCGFPSVDLTMGNHQMNLVNGLQIPFVKLTK